MGSKDVNLRSVDVLVLLKLVARTNVPWTYSALANEVRVVPSQILKAIRRLAAARLVEHGRGARPYNPNVKEFLIHGVKYSFPAVTGTLTRGIPTAYAAPPLNSTIVESGDPPPVWPYARGELRGIALEPISPSGTRSSDRGATQLSLYELLALMDAIRTGRAREREISEQRELERGLRPIKSIYAVAYRDSMVTKNPNLALVQYAADRLKPRVLSDIALIGGNWCRTGYRKSACCEVHHARFRRRHNGLFVLSNRRTGFCDRGAVIHKGVLVTGNHLLRNLKLMGQFMSSNSVSVILAFESIQTGRQVARRVSLPRKVN